jgi:hypothetical protein
MTEFFLGDRVHCKAFGDGVVSIVDGFVPYQTLTVDFDQTGRHVVNPVQVGLELLDRGEEGREADESAVRNLAARTESRLPTAAPAPSRPREEGGLAGEIRRILREELALSDPPLGERWEGGEMILRPGRPGTKEKSIPLDAFFHKIVMVRDRLRVLEQKINAHPKLTDAEKIDLQGYITKTYGSLTTFNVLFAEREDFFVGEKGIGES